MSEKYEITELTADNAGAFFASELPLLIDFGAAWCTQCKGLDPLFESLAESYGDKIRFGKCDVGETPDIAAKYGVRSVPVFLLLKDGEEAAHLYGSISRKQVEAAIQKVIGEA